MHSAVVLPSQEPVLQTVYCQHAQTPYRLAYWQWGAQDAGHVLVCVHGLSRQGRDFDVLAQTLLRDATELNPANASGNRKAAPLEVSDLVRDCVAAAYTEDAAMIAEIRSKAAARTIESKTT